MKHFYKKETLYVEEPSIKKTLFVNKKFRYSYTFCKIIRLQEGCVR